MNEFITSLKDDLTDRRLLPLVGLVAVALVAALVYALAGGGSGSSTPEPPAPSVAATTPATSGIAVSPVTPDKAVAETTDGVKEQKAGNARDPFTLLPGAGTQSSSSSSTTSSSSTGSGSSGSGSGGSGSSSSGSAKEETKASTPSKKQAKKQPVYHVAILFGLFPAGSTPESVTLNPYEDLKLQTPLPSAQQPLIVFRGVTAGGTSATFTIVGETILHGEGRCMPSASQCQALDLKAGQTEQLEYLQPNGETVVYELRLVSIEKAAASSSAKTAKVWSSSRAGTKLLHESGLFELPFLHYSSQPGVLVFSEPQAKDATAHAAVRFRLPRGW